jgi:hypothetical protein
MARRRSPSEPPVQTVAGVPARHPAPADSRRPPRSVSAGWPERGREAPPGVLQRQSAEQRARQKSHVSAQGSVPPLLLAASVLAQGPAPPPLPAVSATGREQQEALWARAWGPASVARRAGLVVTPQAPAEALALAFLEVLHRLAARPIDRAATPPRSVALARGAAEQGTVATRDGAARASAADQARPLALRRTTASLAPADPLALAPRLPPARPPPGQRRRPPMAVRGEGRTWRRRT